MRKWQEDVRRGCLPVASFNATVAETGEPFFISPLSSPDSTGPHHFFDLYPNFDISVATAVRLSATFPYVTPIPRPFGEGLDETKAFHIADGGYYDNSGLFAAADILRELLSTPQSSTLKRIIIVQIQTFESESMSADTTAGWKYVTLGPLVTLNNMRTASQRLRNPLELESLDASAGSIEVTSVRFSLAEERVPLSWHLSGQEVMRIANAWQRQETSVHTLDSMLISNTSHTE
jgi:hypothetical protein